MPNGDRLFMIIMVTSLFLAAGGVGYMMATDNSGEAYTEFYLLGAEEQFQNHPAPLNVREEMKISCAVVNHEFRSTVYTIVMKVNGKRIMGLQPVEIPHGTKWEAAAAFSPAEADDKGKVELYLYKDRNVEPHRYLSFWINVQ